MRASAVVFTLLASLLLLVPAACGGGGGGAPAPTTDAFIGTYGMTGFGGWFGPPLTATALWGEVWPDGRGALTGGLVSATQNGSLYPPGAYASRTYTLSASRRMVWFEGTDAVAEGGLAGDGRLGTMAEVRSSGGLDVYYLAGRGSGFTPAHLDGLYHFAYFVASPTGTGDGTIWGTVTFNGIGTADFTVWSNIDGTVGGPSTATGTYLVAPDGELTFSMSLTTAFSGTIIRGGDVGIFSGSTVGAGVSAMGVFLKHSTAASDATLQGTYHMTALTASRLLAPATNWTGATGTVDADGAGQLTQISLTRKDDTGTVTPLPGPFLPVPYAVAANGGMTVGTSVVGAVSSDGRTAALVGGTITGTDLVLWLLLR